MPAAAVGDGSSAPSKPGAVLAAGARRGPRWRVGIGAAVVLVLVAVAVAVVAGLAAPAASVTEIGPSAPAIALTAAPSPVNDVKIVLTLMNSRSLHQIVDVRVKSIP